jgi:hypothetical protein
MKTRIIILALLFIFAWTFPLTHNVEVNVNISSQKPTPTIPQTEATRAQKSANKATAMRFAMAGWGWDKAQRTCVYKLFMAESKFDHLAKNQNGSSAFGIAQMLKETSKDPEVQILHAYRYIQHRYSTPCKAWRWHQRHNFY